MRGRRWLDLWLGFGRRFSIRLAFDWLRKTNKDECRACRILRKDHGMMIHLFEE